jgi:hypothetical protein
MLLGVAVIVSACSSAGSTSASPSAAASTPGTSTSVAPSASEAAGTPVEIPSLSAAPSAEPSDDALPAFSCSFPVVGDGTVPRAQLADVRVGTHDGYDRIVFEFEEGLPELEVVRATPPLLADGSGMELEVDGQAFLQITLRGGTKQTEGGTSSYDGPLEFTPGFDGLVELEEGGDFEAVSTWYAGLDADACVRGFALDGPPRIVIDVEH